MKALRSGGAGTRLPPVTQVVSKQFLPVCDKPLVYYPLCVPMLAGMREILVISTPEDTPRFWALLGDGSAWSVRFSYAGELRLSGDVRTFIIGDRRRAHRQRQHRARPGRQHLLRREPVGPALQQTRNPSGATVFAPPASDPERYRFVDFHAAGPAVSIDEKTRQPKPRYAATGPYFLDSRVVGTAAGLRPSRGADLIDAAHTPRAAA